MFEKSIIYRGREGDRGGESGASIVTDELVTMGLMDVLYALITGMAMPKKNMPYNIHIQQNTMAVRRLPV